MIKTKPKKCAICKGLFEQRNSLQKVCSVNCSMMWAKEQADKKQKKQAKEYRAETRRRKEKLKTAGDYIKEAQTAFNKYIRVRDGNYCISCGSSPDGRYGGSIDCGHYRSRGAASHLRFNTLNAHSQCKKCNSFMSGNVVEYRINLIKKIGLERVERLENDNEPRKFTIEYLKRLKKIFNKRARHLEKLRNENI